MGGLASDPLEVCAAASLDDLGGVSVISPVDSGPVR